MEGPDKKIHVYVCFPCISALIAKYLFFLSGSLKAEQGMMSS